MSPESGPSASRWERLEAALDRLLDADKDRRAELLAELAGDDAPMHRELVELLAATERSDFLDSPLEEGASDLLAELEKEIDTDSEARLTGHTLGPYELIEPIGRGGMGVVYLAKRVDRQFEKEVAIKLVPQHVLGGEIERRFLAERQILATLEHPGIARLIDGQVSDEGLPYLVMEYVDGRPIDRYCDDEALGIEARLELFLDVCEAVQYAHRNLVIHRDLKPSNILVTSEGQVKLLDFGIAKLLDPASDPGTAATRFQPRTPQYASPEQIANQAVSTASDVYSLGVLLYTLLAENPPYELDGLSAGEAESVVRFDDPPPPSERMAKGRGRRARIVGDLDNITLKALAKEPGRRYSTADRLADDIRRFLNGHPVEARRRTWGYAAAKFVGRHRLGVALSALLLLSIGLGIGGVVWQAQRAEAEAERARRTAAVLAGLFEEANPFEEEVGREMSVIELLERGVERVQTELSDDPATRSELLGLLGSAFDSHYEFDEAAEVHRLALAERRRHFGPESLEAARSMASLASALWKSGERDEAASLRQLALEIFRRELGEESEELAQLLQVTALAAADRGDYDEAERLHREALRIARRPSGEPTAFVAAEMSNLSNVLDATGRREESIELLGEAIELADRTYGPEHPFTTSMRANLAIRLHNLGDYERAESLHRQALAAKEKALGPDSPNLADALTSLGRLLMDKGDFESAERPIRRAVEMRRAHSPEEDFRRIAAEVNLASLLTELGRPEEAEPIYRTALARFRDQLGEEHLATARLQCLLAECLRRSGDRVEAERLARSALAVQRRLPARPARLADTLLVLGGTLVDRGASDEAVPHLEEAFAIFEDLLPADSWKVASAALALAAALELRDESGRARRLATIHLPVLESRLPPDHPRLVEAQALLDHLQSESG
ncbi:MAG: serine/threonine-protein kinase [Thermoanaerobaculia bacterium]|nr:serine/threonine-protein kinase [Thermoanaerobaculia bacterium]